MKKLIAAALLLPTLASAQTLDPLNIKDGILRAANNAGNVVCGTAAVSITVPASAGYVCFSPPAPNYQHCLEFSGNRVCGTAAPVATSSTNAWEKNATCRRLTNVGNNGISSKPDTLWVQPDSATGCVQMRWSAPMPNENF